MSSVLRSLRSGALLLLACAAACAAPARGPTPAAPPAARRPGALPPVPPRSGPLAIDVVYPGEGQTLAVRDSNFIFGSVGTGVATLTIDGARVEVAPNGAFLAYLPVPSDGRYDLQAAAGGQSAQATRTVRFPGSSPVATPAVAQPQAAAPARVVPTPEAPRVAVAASQRADRMTVGTAVPGSGTPYHWFFPVATRLLVTGAQGSQYRVQLTSGLTVWVDTADVDLLPEGTPPPRGSVSVVSASPQAGYVDLRLSTSDRFPFRVDGTERGLTITVYGAETRTNIMQYGKTDPLIHRMEWAVPSDEIYELHVDLNEPLWGFLPFWDTGGNLVVRVMRTPKLDPAEPLRGLYIAVDAGHPPGGAIGPTRLTEAQATLAVTKRLIPLLRDRGARVLEIRPDTAALEVNERVKRTLDSGAQLFVSVHFDAFPDGVNPFTSYGSHTLFNQPQSLDLARAMQEELLLTFGLPDLGVRQQDVAVIRVPAMPAILSETMFMMFPQQEAALRDPDALQRIAEAHLRGIEAFLRARVAAQTR